MNVTLLFACYLLLVAIFRSRGFEWRPAILFATMPWAVFIAISTEVLSVFHLITRLSLSLVWFIACVSCVVFLKLSKRSIQQRDINRDPALELSEISSKTKRAILLIVTVIVLLVGLTAFVSAPNTWDAMEYHLPRVVEWVSNRSVAFFPTFDSQQLSMPPWTEYVMLHLNLLYNGDRLVNLIQWFAFVGCIIGVSYIAKQLGGRARAQLLAALLCATIPQGILAASGPKNDYVLSFWFILTVILMFRWKTEQTWPVLLGIGCCVALCIFTKGTAYTFLPFVLVACFLSWKFPAQKVFLLRAPIVLLVILFINGPLWARNYQFSGSILGPSAPEGAGNSDRRTFGVKRVSFKEAVANVARNSALHLGLPSNRLNVITQHFVERFIRLLGVDPNDPDQIAIGKSGRVWDFFIPVTRQEVMSGNTIHFGIFLIAGLALLLARKANADTYFLYLGTAGAFVLFSVVIRWMAQNGRFHLPVFVLAAAVSAVILAPFLTEKKILLITAFLFILSVPYAVGNYCRPLFKHDGSILTTTRDQTYFFDHNERLAASYIDAASSVRNTHCKNIGIDASAEHFEYPMMALLNKDGAGRAIYYVGVKNQSSIYTRPSDVPVCTVVCFNCKMRADKWQQYASWSAHPAVFGDVLVFSAERN
jgi:4-amino-4-deoxy-L-arabinose transferase-like glycosyltransferase